MANFDSTVISLELSTGATVPMRPTVAKSGNIFHAILKGGKPNKFGVKVAPSVVGGDLPETIKVFGKTIHGVKGTTQSGNVKVSFSETVETPGGTRQLRFQVSALADGNFNVLGSCNRPGGGANKVAVDSL